MAILIADSGSTKCEWSLVSKQGSSEHFTQGMSPYFLNAEQLTGVVRNELVPSLTETPTAVYFYGTGCKHPDNAARVKLVLSDIFPAAAIFVTHDLMGAARSLCQQSPGIAC